ncbi:amidase [Dietzia sp.]|uniref:amidase n=1 Tax=Dietzia sp. TaxID=1871616 RepID=UPI002FD938CC
MSTAPRTPESAPTAVEIADAVHSGELTAVEAWLESRELAEAAGEPAGPHAGPREPLQAESRRQQAASVRAAARSGSGSGGAGGAGGAAGSETSTQTSGRKARAENHARSARSRRAQRNRTGGRGDGESNAGHARRISAYTGFLNSEAREAAEFIDILPEDARATLPLAGVPFAVKSNVTLDAPSIRRLLSAGAVPVAMTTTPEFCVWGATDSASFGITRNPWNPELTPGGSSGGSAAAVAAGLVPFAHGNDGMGSLRIPAACCGLVTLKPGPGIVPTELGADNWGGMSEDGVLATTVADLGLATAAMAGDPALAERSTPRPLRIVLALNSPLSLAGRPLVRVDRKIVKATRAVAKALEGLGHTVVEADLPYPRSPWPLLARWTSGLDADAAAANFPISRMERRNRYHALVGRLLRGKDAYGAQKKEREILDGFMRGGSGGDRAGDRGGRGSRSGRGNDGDEGPFDLILTPTLARAPIAAEAWHERSWMRSLWANLRYAPFSSLFNHLAWPAMSIPAGTARIEDTPIGVQLAGRPGTESLLLDVAAQLESALPWTRTADVIPAGAVWDSPEETEESEAPDQPEG